MPPLIGHEVTLYAWGVPVGLTDHTWVTDYDLRECVNNNRPPPYMDIDAVIRDNKHYWYCSDHYKENDIEIARFHPGNEEGTHFLGKATAILERAASLVTPNEQFAGGTIATYGLDGTCHQIANQVLAATAWGNSPKPAYPPMTGTPPAAAQNWPPVPLYEPLTVRKALNYWASEWAYGTYGRTLAAWTNWLAECLKQEYVLDKQIEPDKEKDKEHHKVHRTKHDARVHVHRNA